MGSIKIETVYKNSQGRQISADILVDGKLHEYVPIVQIAQQVKSGNYVADNFIVTSSGVRGRDCNLEFKEYLTWDEIVKRYPNKWVALDHAIYEEAGNYLSRPVGGVVVNIFTDDSMPDVLIKYYSGNKYYDCRRTLPVVGTLIGG